jgi:hypothetical protein
MSVESCGQHATAWNFFHAAWNCMELHETAWNFFHAAWNCMELHETAWNCMKKSMQHEKEASVRQQQQHRRLLWTILHNALR